MADFVEVAARVWVARYPWCDVNITLIGGERGVIVVDTHASELAAREVLDDVRRLAGLGRTGEVVGVVNTHEHFDHVFGNAVFRDADGAVPIYAHEWAAAHTRAAGERVQAAYAEDLDDPHRDEVLATRIVPADHSFSSASVLDLGDRMVELVHPGRGHTAGDLVVRVPDADVLLAGDLIEESALPGMWGDCHPLDWPATLDLVLQLVGDRTTVVPGHGAPVDRAFVEAQRDDLAVIAETIRGLAGRGVPVDQALAAAEWPWPVDLLGEAVRRGYDQLPRGARRLPLA